MISEDTRPLFFRLMILVHVLTWPAESPAGGDAVVVVVGIITYTGCLGLVAVSVTHVTLWVQTTCDPQVSS